MQLAGQSHRQPALKLAGTRVMSSHPSRGRQATFGGSPTYLAGLSQHATICLVCDQLQQTRLPGIRLGEGQSAVTNCARVGYTYALAILAQSPDGQRPDIMAQTESMRALFIVQAPQLLERNASSIPDGNVHVTDAEGHIFHPETFDDLLMA